MSPASHRTSPSSTARTHGSRGQAHVVRLRADARDSGGDGRVYRIAFRATDGNGGECAGVAQVTVPRHRHRPAVDSAPPSYDSLAP